MDSIARFEERLHQAFQVGASSKRLAHVGGNFTFAIHGKAAWSVYTKGEKLGIVEGAAKDMMDFVMIMTPEVFEQMYQAFEGDPTDLDFEPLLEAQKIAAYGDPDVFIRYLALNAGGNMLAMRGGAAASVKSTPKKARSA